MSFLSDTQTTDSMCIGWRANRIAVVIAKKNFEFERLKVNINTKATLRTCRMTLVRIKGLAELVPYIFALIQKLSIVSG